MFGDVITGLADAEVALVELRDLDWRYQVRSPRLGFSPVATDLPTRLMQPDVDTIAGDFSETLLTNASGKELLVRKLDSRRPRTPLCVAEVERMNALFGWLGLLPEVADRRIIWAASFHLWRGEVIDWKAIAGRIGWGRSVTRLAGRYPEALAKLICRVNGVPERHWRALLAREAGYFTSAARQESLGFGTVKW